MGDSTLAIADFERAMAAIFGRAGANQFADVDFDTMSRLLAQVGKPQWSIRPRIYAVLRMIDRIDHFDAFMLEGLKDIAFPYIDSRLPSSLSPTVKAKFLQVQNLVLTKASDLEKSDGRHRHLDQDADTHFDILKILGRGGFGEVHHVRSKLSLEEYARKRVHRKKAFSKEIEAIKIFENELTNLKRLSHHHLVKFVGSYTDPRYVGLLISPVADCDLKFFLERDPFPKDDLLLLRGFFGCLCSAVLYLHKSKCRHKDLKPGNILVYMKNILITDFGTARDWSEKSYSMTTGRSGIYTPGYAAPEVVNDEPRSSSADIWSLGCVYLDIMTVLRGETLASKDQFFAENGTGGGNPRSNAKAFELWLAVLKSRKDMQPLEWIKQMIKNAPNERITAAGLMDWIHSDEDGYIYYNSCCNGEEESDDEISPPIPRLESKVRVYVPSRPLPSVPRSDIQRRSNLGSDGKTRSRRVVDKNGLVNPLFQIEETFTSYITALQSRKGNIDCAVLRNRDTIDEYRVNALYNSFIENPLDAHMSSEASIDFLFTAFEKFLRLAWTEHIGPVVTLQTLEALQDKVSKLFPEEFADFTILVFGDLAPQNRRAFAAIVKLLADLLDGGGNDDDRGSLTAVFAELLVAEGDPYSFINLLDCLVEDFDRLFDDKGLDLRIPYKTEPAIEPKNSKNGERGRLFAKFMAVKDLDLPLPKSERTWFSLTLDNRIHRVTTSWFELSKNAPIGQEFELVVPDNLEFQVTLNVKLNEPKSKHIIEPPRNVIEPPKSSTLSHIFTSSKKRKEMEMKQKEEQRTAEQEQQELQAKRPPVQPTAWDLLSPLAAEDGRFGRLDISLKDHESRCFGRPYFVDIICFNEWATKETTATTSVKSKLGNTPIQRRTAFEIGKVEVQLLFVPKSKGAIDKDLPNSINSCIREMKEAEQALARSWEGYLSQKGGDCLYWRRRFFKLTGNKLTAYHETTRQPRTTINLANTSELIDNQSALTQKETTGEDGIPCISGFAEEEGYMFVEKGFRLCFENGEIIDFHADSLKDKEEWMIILKLCVGKDTLVKGWCEMVLNREEALRRKAMVSKIS